MAEDSENKKDIKLDLDFESIVPWDGQQDTGRDVRLKLDRNWQKVVDAFNYILRYNNFNALFTPHYEDPTDPEKITWIEAKSNLGVRGGVTSFINSDDFDLPSLYDGLPIDNTTLVWQEVKDAEGNVTDRILAVNPELDFGGGFDEEELKNYLTSNQYAKKTDIPSLDDYATEKWVENKKYIDSTTLSNELVKYVTLANDESIDGFKDFKKGLGIDGLGITKLQDDVIYLDANLVVRGGITMYGTNSVDVGSIYDGLPIDGATIYWDGKVLKAKQTESGIDENFLVSYLTSNNYAKKSDIPSLVGYATQSWVEGKKYLTGITSALVTTALGYTPLKNHQALYALTIQKNGTNIDTYTPNSAKKTINIVVPTKVSELDNDEEYATTSDLDSRINTLINGAPTAFDTLKEIADVLQGNVNSIGDIIITLGTKADKSIKISAGTGISGGGTLEADRTLSLATSGVTVGTYKSVTVDKYGRVTSGTNPTTLAGYGITDVYTKSAVDTLLNGYVTLATKQDITGEKNFKSGLKVNGMPIVYDATNKYWKLEGDLLVTGGISMFSSDSAFTPFTIMDAIATDNVNLKVVDGVLTFVGTTGGLSEVHWDDVIGRPTLLSSFIDDVVDGHYLPLSGGKVTGQIEYNLDRDTSIGLVSIPAAGAFQYNDTMASEGSLNQKKSFIGTARNSSRNTWWNLISIRHANGSASDSNIYGMYITSSMTDDGSMYWNKQIGTGWIGERVILDSVNWSQYVTAADGGRYLPLSGGYMSGHIFMNTGAAIVDSTSASGYYMLGYDTGSGRMLVGTPEKTLSIRFKEFAYLDEYVFIRSNQNNPYIGLIHGGYTWYLQAYNNNYLYLGAGSANSLRVDASGNILTPGGITMYSDIRKKTKLADVELTLKQVADAPLIQHYYNSDNNKTTHVGSIAQYWAETIGNDWFCKLDNEGFYTMEIQNAALASAISIARELQRYESKTDKKIRLLKKRIGELEDEIEKLKKKGA